MELILPYLEAESFKRGLVGDYGFEQTDIFNASFIKMPESLGVGKLLLFNKGCFHFFRGTWNFAEETIFHSVHKVGHNDMMDFRINTAGAINSNYISGSSEFEHDTTDVDGMRIFVPKTLFSRDKGLLLQKIIDSDNDYLRKDQLHNIFSMQFDTVQNSLLIESKILEFLSHWIQYLQTSERETANQRAFERKVFIAKEFIDANITNEITIHQISRYSGLNSSDLKKGFKHYVKLPIRQYIIRNRMLHARELLITTNKPISEVCDLAGYSNQGHFSQLYMRLFGKKPSDERR